MATRPANVQALITPTEGGNFWDRVVRETANAKKRLYDNPCFSSFTEGTMPLEQYKQWLQETYHFTRNTPRFLAAAGSKVEDDQDVIRTRFFKHCTEENGHHLMALKDLKSLGVDVEQVKKTRPRAGTNAIVAFHYYLAMYSNPIGIFGAISCFEGLAIEVCTRAAEGLKKTHNIGNNCVTFLISHGHFDTDHIEEAKEVLNKHIKTDKDREDIIYVANRMYDYYRLMFEEIAESTS